MSSGNGMILVSSFALPCHKWIVPKRQIVKHNVGSGQKQGNFCYEHVKQKEEHYFPSSIANFSLIRTSIYIYIYIYINIPHPLWCSDKKSPRSALKPFPLSFWCSVSVFFFCSKRRVHSFGFVVKSLLNQANLCIIPFFIALFQHAYIQGILHWGRERLSTPMQLETRGFYKQRMRVSQCMGWGPKVMGGDNFSRVVWSGADQLLWGNVFFMTDPNTTFFTVYSLHQQEKEVGCLYSSSLELPFF